MDNVTALINEVCNMQSSVENDLAEPRGVGRKKNPVTTANSKVTASTWPSPCDARVPVKLAESGDHAG